MLHTLMLFRLCSSTWSSKAIMSHFAHRSAAGLKTLWRTRAVASIQR
jgi:hypothetical protein